ncbi:unnamed protein product [Rhizoctonia solani]|uniref:Chromo domain-containing protein n=1 Tax=Rhizoctonia solani TaxID=456999 RepID=A0A8H3BYL9_9AGAM|nr:unnamed protein product [Rhizoctonia solani]
MSQFPAGYETQFQSQSDDEENLYNVERILAEKGRKYLVQWEGIDPVTGEKWKPDWVPKTDCTDDLIADWKREKARMKQKGRGTPFKSVSYMSGSVNAPQSKMSHSVSGKSTSSRMTEASTSARSRSPAPLPKASATSRRESAFCIELPVPRRTKRRRDSDPKEDPMSPVKKMKLGGPPSPLPASPFDDDDGGVGEMFPKKRFGPVTYKGRKPKVVESTAFPKLTGPYVREDKEGQSSRGLTNPEPTKHRTETSRNDDANTETETEDEDYPPPPPKRGIDGRNSPLKSKSEPVLKPRTRNTARNAPDEPLRAASLPFERPHPTSAARTRALPPRSRSAAQREVRRQMLLEPPGPPEDFPLWPRVVGKDDKLRRRSGSKSRTSSIANSSRKSAGETSIAGPSAPSEAKALVLPENEAPHPPVTAAAPAPAPVTTSVLAPTRTRTPTPSLDPTTSNPSPDAPKRSSLAKSMASSSARPSSAKSVSFRVDGSDDFDEHRVEHAPHSPGERTTDLDHIVPNVELENKPLPQEPTQPAPIDPELPQTQSQSQSNSDSSKSTHISDSEEGIEEGGKYENQENEAESEVDESEVEVENLELVPREPGEDEDEEEEEDGSEEDQEEQREDRGSGRQEEEDESDEIEEEGGSTRSSPSLGGDGPPPAPDIGIQSPGRQPSPFLEIQQDGSLDPPRNTGDADEVQNVEPLSVHEESYEVADVDVSMDHATEVDMLLSSDISQHSGLNEQEKELEGQDEDEDEQEQEQDEEDEEEDSMATFGDSTLDPLNLTIDDASQEHHTEEPGNNTQTPTDLSSERIPAPYSRTAIDHPTTREVISTLLPGILDTSSQSQSQSQSQSHSLPAGTPDSTFIPPTFPSQTLSDLIAQPGSQPQSEQIHTHSSIEQPASSWSIPRPGQLPHQNDTISNFTPTNPSIKPAPAIPSPDRELITPSTLDVGINGHDQVDATDPEPPSQMDVSQPSQEIGLDSAEARSIPTSGLSSELGVVPDMNVEVFKKQVRHSSPESDIGDFSPRKFSPGRPSPRSSERASVRPYQQTMVHQSSPSPKGGWNNAHEDARKQIQEQATRIQALLADLANLEAAKKAIEAEASAFVQSTNRLNEVFQQAREEHAQEAETQANVISDLKTQLEVIRNQYDTAESQREFALEQYTRASTEAKRMSDENKALEAKIKKLERQLSSGLRQWRSGFESNVVRHKQEVQTLQGQLKLEREMYARSKAPELCRRAAEWYELKKRVEELEEEATEAERLEALLREREGEIRRRELAVADREQALEDSVRATQSQAQTTQRLSQDDLQTESMLTNQSTILASLDGELGEEMVWMCSYRESTGKICGKVFESMGLTPLNSSLSSSPWLNLAAMVHLVLYTLSAISVVAKAQYTATYLPNNVPAHTEEGQIGTNQCGSGNSQTSLCQSLYVNSVEDFCLWAPPYSDGKNSSIGEVEQIVVSWCVKPGYGTRLIPDGTIKGAHFVQTPDYVQVTGWGDFTKMNVPKGDAGGELDPHGADGLGNPHGGLVFGSSFGKLQQYHEWTNFMSATEFCVRACKDGPSAAKICNHIYDIMGCEWNMPGNYAQGVFENCLVYGRKLHKECWSYDELSVNSYLVAANFFRHFWGQTALSIPYHNRRKCRKGTSKW